MRHISGNDQGAPGPRCSLMLEDGDVLVQAAMESDCNLCRAAVMVQPVEWSDPKKTPGAPSYPLNVSPGVAPYEPQPLAGFENALQELQERRGWDGRDREIVPVTVSLGDALKGEPRRSRRGRKK